MLIARWRQATSSGTHMWPLSFCCRVTTTPHRGLRCGTCVMLLPPSRPWRATNGVFSRLHGVPMTPTSSLLQLRTASKGYRVREGKKMRKNDSFTICLHTGLMIFSQYLSCESSDRVVNRITLNIFGTSLDIIFLPLFSHSSKKSMCRFSSHIEYLNIMSYFAVLSFTMPFVSSIYGYLSLKVGGYVGIFRRIYLKLKEYMFFAQHGWDSLNC